MNRWFTSLGLVVAAGLVGSVWLHAQNGPAAEARKDKDKAHTVTTTGTAKVRVACDSARVYASVEAVAATVRPAREETLAGINRLTAALKALKLEGVKMKTADLTIDPRTEDKDGAPPKILGYRVKYDFTVLIENEDVVKLNDHTGKVMDALLNSGVNKVDRVTFFKKDETAAQRQARTKAVEDAIANARALLAGAKLERFEVTEISDVPSLSPWGGVMGFGGMQNNPFNPANAPAQAADETRIMAGELEVSCTVTVTCSY